MTRREYRGQRSVDAFSNYVREQMKSKVQEFHTLADLHVDVRKAEQLLLSLNLAKSCCLVKQLTGLPEFWFLRGNCVYKTIEWSKTAFMLFKFFYIQ